MDAGTERMSDLHLPGLDLALDHDAFLGLLSEHLPECREGVRFLGGRVADVQYTPGARAHVLWKLRADDPETGRTGRQLVYVKVMRRGDAMPAEPVELVARYKALRGQKGMAREMPFRTPWLCVPQLHLVVCAFPLDPALPTLMDVVDPQVMKEALHRAWRGRRARVRRVRTDTLSYTPEARAALRFEVLAEDKDTGLPELRHLVGKLHVRRPPARLFAGHWAIWRKSMGRVSIAPPVGYVAVAQLSLQEFLAGTRLSDLADRATFQAQLRETARGIGHVHSLLLPLLTVRGVEKELTAVDRWVGILSQIRPAYAGRLETIGRRLRREVEERMRITGTVHADFHLANVLADDRGVTFIDWDQAAHGDPMVDVGRVLASLRVSSLRVHGTLDGFADAEESFLRAYLDHTGEDERRARLFEAVSLLIAAAAPFRLQREGWQEGAELMLEEVERVLALSLAGPRLPGTAPELKREVPFEERAQWMLDRSYAQALLLPLVQEAYGTDVEVTECLPSLDERGPDRLHARWELKGYKGSERWRSVVEGVGFPDDSGRGRLRRMELAAASLTMHPEALQLPRPLGHLGPLSMIAFVPPEGQPLAELLGTEREAEALHQVAHALAHFHALDMNLEKERETERDVRSVGRRIERLEEAGHPEAPAARELFERLTPLLSGVGERLASTVRGLTLQHLRVGATGAGASLLNDVLRAEPLMTIAELLAQLHLYALERGIPPSAAERLGCVYAEVSGATPGELAAFEALWLLWCACRRGVKNPRDPLVALLISTAHEVVITRAGGTQTMEQV